jgi:thiol-disulfide isomerase/thioredoxin
MMFMLFMASLVLNARSQINATLTGRILAASQSKVYLRNDQETINASIVNDTFTFSVPVKQESVYELLYGDNAIEIYMEPEDHLTVETVDQDFYNAMKFSGQHANENLFSLQRDLRRSNIYNPVLRSIRKRSVEAFIKSLDSIMHSMQNDLMVFAKKAPLSQKFRFIESVNLKFIAANQRSVYSGNYGANHPGVVLDPAYYNYLDTLDYHNPKFLLSPRFRDFVRNHRYNAVDNLLKERPELKDSISGNIAAMFAVVNKLFTNQIIRDYALYTSLKYELRMHGLDIPAPVISSFYSLCKNDDYVSDIKSNYYTWTTLSSGKPAPDFNLHDANGNPVTLKNFRGRIAYIDVWATWCGPCIAEMPHLDTLVAAYSGSTTMAFLKISIDVNENAWQKKLKSQPNVVNLRAAEGANSAFAKAYAIRDIPRYMIIDPNGKIVQVNAPPPSSPDIRKELDRLIRMFSK